MSRAIPEALLRWDDLIWTDPLELWFALPEASAEFLYLVFGTVLNLHCFARETSDTVSEFQYGME